MTLQDWGALGELIGGTAIIVTLVYLAVQTRQAARVSAAHAPQWISDGYRSWFLSLRSDPNFVRLVRFAVHHWDKMSNNDKTRVHSFWAEMIVHLDAVLTLRKQGLMGEEHARAWADNTLGLITTPGGEVWWLSTKFLYSPQVRRELEHRLEDATTLPPTWTTIPFYELEDADLAALQPRDDA